MIRNSYCLLKTKDMNPIILILVFAASTIGGYKIIKKVPSLLHTPLMSGMNALSGITIIGAIASFALLSRSSLTGAKIIAAIAIILATINVVGGFGVTNRMLKMFNKKKGGKS